MWGYIDARGVAHFAAERQDDRYELFYKGDQGGVGFDSRDGVKPLTETPRPVAVPTAPPKLLAYFEVSPSYKAVKHHLREASSQHDIEYELLQALIATESGFDATAVSPKGAVGLMQLMPATAQRYGVRADPKTSVEKKLADPRTNIGAGTRYLRDLINLFPGRLELALAAYNAGEGAVQRAGNQIPNYRETQNYVKTVLQLYHVLKPPPAIAAARRTPSRVRVRAGRRRPVVPLAAATCRRPSPATSGRNKEKPTPDMSDQPTLDFPQGESDDSLNLATYAQRAYLEYAL